MIANEEIVISSTQFSAKDITNQFNNLRKLSTRNRSFSFDKEEVDNELLCLDNNNKEELRKDTRNLSGRSINPTKRELYLDFRAALKSSDPLQVTKTISKPVTSPRSPRSPHSPHSPHSSHGLLPNLATDSPHSARNLSINNRNSWHSSLDNIFGLDKRTRSASDKTTDSSNTDIDMDSPSLHPSSEISLDEISKEIQVIEYSEISNTILPNVASIVSPRSAFTPILSTSQV